MDEKTANIFFCEHSPIARAMMDRQPWLVIDELMNFHNHRHKCKHAARHDWKAVKHKHFPHVGELTGIVWNDNSV